jgi:hypothetical protein
MAMNATIMRNHGGRAVHCQHQTTGTCGRPGCETALTSGSERMLSDRDESWVFPNATALVTAMRASR